MREAAVKGDHRGHVDADYAFHHAIIKASGNRMLQHVWQTMRLATTTFVTHSMTQLTHRSLHEIGERHVPVLEALRDARSESRGGGDAAAHRGARRVDTRCDRGLRQGVAAIVDEKKDTATVERRVKRRSRGRR